VGVNYGLWSIIYSNHQKEILVFILEPLIAKHLHFEEYARAFKFIEDNRDRTMKVMVDL